MEKQFAKAEKFVNKIIKQMKRSDIDWTIQVSKTSIEPETFKYCCQIEAPAEGLQPLTYVKNSWEELLEALEESAKVIDYNMIQKTWHEGQIIKHNKMIEYHKESIEKLEFES